jgi:hypothetical protein
MSFVFKGIKRPSEARADQRKSWIRSAVRAKYHRLSSATGWRLTSLATLFCPAAAMSGTCWVQAASVTLHVLVTSQMPGIKCSGLVRAVCTQGMCALYCRAANGSLLREQLKNSIRVWRQTWTDVANPPVRSHPTQFTAYTRGRLCQQVTGFLRNAIYIVNTRGFHWSIYIFVNSPDVTWHTNQYYEQTFACLPIQLLHLYNTVLVMLKNMKYQEN